MNAYDAVLNNGPSANRVDIVFAGDGYRTTEIDTAYVQHVDALIGYLFGGGLLTDPFGRYGKFFDAWRVNVVSAESGADDPSAGVFRDTALGASYLSDGVTQRALSVSTTATVAAVVSALAGTGIDPEMRFVTVNDTQYGGTGGLFAVYAGDNAAALEVALHEVGHSFAGLADEYNYGGYPGAYVGPEPGQPNLTTDPTGAKWAAWLGYDQPGIGTIGAYEGGFYQETGIWRPSFASKMNVLGAPFDAIGREAFIQHIYAEVRPLDAYTANATVLADTDSLFVLPVDAQVIKVRWSVDGQVVLDGNTDSFDLSDAGYGPGTYSVTALAYDDTDWVRGNRDLLEERITWTVRIDAPAEEPGGQPEMAGHGHHAGRPAEWHAHHDWMA